MPDDLFHLFRYFLGFIVTVYATVVLLQDLWGWYVYLTGGDKYVSLLRQYLILHGLRLRFKTFWGDAIICLLLCAAFLVIWRAHGVVYDLEKRVQDVRRITK